MKVMLHYSELDTVISCEKYYISSLVQPTKTTLSCNFTFFFFLMDHLPVMFVGLQAGQKQNWVFLLSLVWIPILVQTLFWILVWKISWHSCSSLLPLMPQIFMLYSIVPCVSLSLEGLVNFLGSTWPTHASLQGWSHKWGWFNVFIL